MSAMTSLFTSLTIVYSTVYSDADLRKHQSSASLAFVWGIHRGPVNSPNKWPLTQKMFPFDDAIIDHYLCIGETLKHISVHWREHENQLGANWFVCWMPIANRGFHGITGISTTHCCVECANTRPWSISQKRNSTSRMVSLTQHSSQPILGKNDSPRCCLHLAPAYRLFLFWWDILHFRTLVERNLLSTRL